MTLRFTIIDYTNDPDGVSTVVDEPVGWDSTGMRLKRDKTWHGFFDFFDDSYSGMQWHGAAHIVLKAAYDANGVEANCELLVEVQCSNTDEYEQVYLGKFVFERYKSICGEMCYVLCGVENSNCLLSFRNRYDQKVDLDSLSTFDNPCVDSTVGAAAEFTAPDTILILGELNGLVAGAIITISGSVSNNGTFTVVSNSYDGLGLTTLVVEEVITTESAAISISGCLTKLELVAYDALNKEVTLPKVRIRKTSEWRIEPQTFGFVENFSEGGWGVYETPILGQLYSELQNSYAFTEWYEINDSTFEFSQVPPIMTAMEANIQYPITIEYDIDISGVYTDNQTIIGESRTNIEMVLYLVHGTKNTEVDSLDFITLFDASGYTADPFSVNFDTASTGTGSFALNQGESVWLVWRVSYAEPPGIGGTATVDVDWVYNQSRITFTADTQMNDTKAKVYLVNEALSRVAEIYTNDCLRAKSDYFGRTDSQPYTSDEDGCAGLESITNGLKIRNATLQDGNPPKVTVSMRDMFDGLNAIHNIGMGIEPDTERGGDAEWIRVEPMPYFYKNDVLMECDNIMKVEREFDRIKVFTTSRIGYAKWEAEEVNGLNDLFGKREYRTSLNQLRIEHTAISKFIASCNAIEVTRRKFGLSTKDWRYDNDTFIICLVRDDDEFLAEQDIVESASGVTYAEDLYNLRITPSRNAIRHLKTLFQSYRDFANGKLIFTAGDGNFVAIIDLNDDDCLNEDGGLAENQDLQPSHLVDEEIAFPLFWPELVKFEYPMSWEQYKVIRANPYGLIGYQCGNDAMEYGWIEDFQYKPYKGLAEFTLRPKIEA